MVTAESNVNKVKLDNSFLRLSLIEQFMFAHLDREALKTNSFSKEMNKITLGLCEGLEKVLGYTTCEEKNKFRKQYKRWTWIFVLKLLLHFGWLPEPLIEKINKKATKSSNFRAYQDDIDENIGLLVSTSSTLFTRIAELLHDVLTDSSFYNPVRIRSLVDVVEINNSNDKRGNKLNPKLENIVGDTAGTEAIAKYHLGVINKKQISMKKKVAKKTKYDQNFSTPSVSNKNLSSTTLSAPNPSVPIPPVVLNTINNYYGSTKTKVANNEVKPKGNVIDLSVDDDVCDDGQSAEQIWSKLEGMYEANKLLESLYFTSMKTNEFGTKIILNVKQLKLNPTIMCKMINCLEKKGTNSQEEGVKELAQLLRSDYFSFIYLKLSPPIRKTYEFQNFVSPNGYCFYQCFFLVFVAHILCLTDKDELKTCDVISEEFAEERQRTISTYTHCQKSPLPDDSCDDENLKKARISFRNFWIKINDFIKSNKNVIEKIKDDNFVFAANLDSTYNNELVDTLSNGIEGVVHNLTNKTSKSEGFKDLPNSFWQSKECFILLTMIVYKMTNASIFQIVQNKFCIDMYTEYDTESNTLASDFGHLIDNEYAFNDNPPDGDRSNCVLNFSSRMEIYDECKVAKPLHTFKELYEQFMDPYKRVVFTGGNHYTILPSAEQGGQLIEQERDNLDHLVDSIVENLFERVKEAEIIEEQFVSKIPNSLFQTHVDYSKAIRRMRKISEEVRAKDSLEKVYLNQPASIRDLLNFQNDSRVKDHINERFVGILECIGKETDQSRDIWDTIEDETLYQLYGGVIPCQVRITEVLALSKQSDQTMTFTSTINLVASIINVYSNNNINTCEMFVFDFMFSTIICNSSEETIKNNQITNIHPIQLIQLRIKLAKIIMVPYVGAGHFAIIFLIPTIREAFWVDSRYNHFTSQLKRTIMRKMILYCSSKIGKSSIQIGDWKLNINGDGSELVEQQGGTLNCGIFAKSYALAIAFSNLNMDQMIEAFRTGNYHSMFKGIKCTEMLIRRRLLTVLLHDRKKYLLPA